MTRFVIFHAGRCGSTVLTSMINQNVELFCDGENFTHHFSWLNKSAPEFLEHRLNYAERTKPHVGFEFKFFRGLNLKAFDNSNEALLDALSGSKVKKFIFLRRKNSLARMASTLIALKRKEYNSPVGQAVELPKIVMPVDALWLGEWRGSLLEMCDWIEEQYYSFKSNFDDVLSLSYEDDIQGDPVVAYTKFCQYLGVEEHDAVPRFQKIVTQPLSETIKNWSAVAGALKGTRHEWMLDS
jgi:hypothetical protein